MANLWRNKGNLIGTNNREGILFINLFHRSLSTYFQGYNYPQSMVPYTGDFVMNKTNPNNPLCWGACDLKNSHLWSLLGGKLKKKTHKKHELWENVCVCKISPNFALDSGTYEVISQQADIHAHSSSPFLHGESEGLNGNQSRQFIFNFFLLSQDWFLSWWSIAQRIAPWPKQLFKCMVWLAPHLSNRTLEADYESNRMKMFKNGLDYPWLPGEECLQGGTAASQTPEKHGACALGAELRRVQHGRRAAWEFAACLPTQLPSSLLFLVLPFSSTFISSVLYQLLLDLELQAKHLLHKNKRQKEIDWLFPLSFLGFKIASFWNSLLSSSFLVF